VAQSKSGSGEPITIKKYANRRLYNTATSSYVTLDHLCDMVKEGQDFVVYDAKTGEDITRSVLTQIIFEQEGKGQNLLPIQFLRQLISFYDDQMSQVVPGYLDMSMETLTKHQDEVRERMTEAFGNPAQSMRMFEEMTKANLALFQETWTDVMRRMMGVSGTATATKSEAAGEDKEAEMNALKQQVAAMQEQLSELSKKD
jgi:polyhydroxyalkanoate synthesis repressor PhaR